MDAIDDWTRDCNNGSWNPYGGLDLATARAAAGERLADLELEMDRPRRCCLIGGMAVSSPTSLPWVFRIPANGFCEEKTDSTVSH